MKQQTFSFTQNTAILKFSMSNFSVKYYSETRKTDSQSQKSQAKNLAKTLWFTQKDVGQPYNLLIKLENQIEAIDHHFPRKTNKIFAS